MNEILRNETPPDYSVSGETPDGDEVTQLICDIRMIGDLLIAANNSPDQLLDDTPSNAGMFIERAAGRLQTLLNGGAS